MRMICREMKILVSGINVNDRILENYLGRNVTEGGGEY